MKNKPTIPTVFSTFLRSVNYSITFFYIVLKYRWYRNFCLLHERVKEKEKDQCCSKTIMYKNGGQL
jgi:hypothetical protein